MSKLSNPICASVIVCSMLVCSIPRLLLPAHAIIANTWPLYIIILCSTPWICPHLTLFWELTLTTMGALLASIVGNVVLIQFRPNTILWVYEYNLSYLRNLEILKKSRKKSFSNNDQIKIFLRLVFVISVINAGICPMFPHIQSLNNSLPLYLCGQQPNPGHAAAPPYCRDPRFSQILSPLSSPHLFSSSLICFRKGSVVLFFFHAADLARVRWSKI